MLKINEELILEIREMVFAERRMHSDLLQRIAEVDRRRLYLELGFSSLFDWLIKDLGYSHSAAYRRMQASRLLRSVPEVAEWVESGQVNLTTLSQLQTAIAKEERATGEILSVEARRELIEQIESRSSTEVEKVIAERFATAQGREDERMTFLPEGRVQLTLVFSEQQMEKLQRVQELLSHKHFDDSWATLVESLADRYLQQRDPLRKELKSSRVVGSSAEGSISTSISRTAPALHRAAAAEVARLVAMTTPARISSAEAPAVSCAGDVPAAEEALRQVKSRRLHLPEEIKRAVFQRDQGQCTYRNPSTGQMCGSRFQLEIDHVKPVAQGGEDRIENLRCLCRAHNLFAAEESFGRDFMSRFRKKHAEQFEKGPRAVVRA